MLKTRIKEIRQSKGMSLRMLADISGTSKESIINLETGRTDPKLSTLLAVADASSTRPAWGLAGPSTWASHSQHSSPTCRRSNMTRSHGRM